MTRRFQPVNAPRLSKEEAARQSQVTNLALASFGKPSEVIAFLNEPDEALGGSPLEVAIASPAGLLAVERRIAER